MYDYMKALQERFDKKPPDAQNILLEEATLLSFTAGFKLAWGMAKELETDGLYAPTPIIHNNR